MTEPLPVFAANAEYEKPDGEHAHRRDEWWNAQPYALTLYSGKDVTLRNRLAIPPMC